MNLKLRVQKLKTSHDSAMKGLLSWQSIYSSVHDDVPICRVNSSLFFTVVVRIKNRNIRLVQATLRPAIPRPQHIRTHRYFPLPSCCYAFWTHSGNYLLYATVPCVTFQAAERREIEATHLTMACAPQQHWLQYRRTKASYDTVITHSHGSARVL